MRKRIQVAPPPLTLPYSRPPFRRVLPGCIPPTVAPVTCSAQDRVRYRPLSDHAGTMGTTIPHLLERLGREAMQTQAALEQEPRGMPSLPPLGVESSIPRTKRKIVQSLQFQNPDQSGPNPGHWILGLE